MDAIAMNRLVRDGATEQHYAIQSISLPVQLAFDAAQKASDEFEAAWAAKGFAPQEEAEAEDAWRGYYDLLEGRD